MKQPLNMHRPSSVIAAVLMILSQVLNIAASLSASNDYFTRPMFLISLFGNAVITVMLSVILFRGRKDAFAGVMFLLQALRLCFLYSIIIWLRCWSRNRFSTHCYACCPVCWRLHFWDWRPRNAGVRVMSA